jgi:hypothetical protein
MLLAMSRKQLGLGAIAISLLVGTGCNVSSEPPAKVVEEAREAITERRTRPPFSDTPRIEPVRPLVTATSPRIRPREEFGLSETAADALARIGPASVPQVIPLLFHSDPAQRRQAAGILAQMGSAAEQAVPSLTALLNDPDPAVRKAAAHALGQIGPAAASAVPALVQAAAAND